MKPRHTQTAAALLLLTAAVLYRLCAGLFGGLPNFSPVAAIALCGGVFLAPGLAFPLPLAALFFSDLALNAHYGVPLLGTEMLARYIALGLAVALGWALRERAKAPAVLAAAVAGSLLFYVLTNTASWLGSPRYAQSFAGWLQALTLGVPGYPPTWMFFRNTLLSDLLFTALFLACMAAPAFTVSPRSTRAACP